MTSVVTDAACVEWCRACRVMPRVVCHWRVVLQPPGARVLRRLALLLQVLRVAPLLLLLLHLRPARRHRRREARRQALKVRQRRQRRQDEPRQRLTHQQLLWQHRHAHKSWFTCRHFSVKDATITFLTKGSYDNGLAKALWYNDILENFIFCYYLFQLDIEKKWLIKT